MMKRIALSCLSLASIVAAYPETAHAQHKSPLADAPAIRKRVELRDKRFELGVAGGSTLNETFYHDILVSGHLAFHITDWLSIGAVGIFGVSSLSTGFNDELNSTLTTPPQGRAPSPGAAKAGWNKPASILLGQVEWTPFTGKFSLFGKLFAHYDFYIAPGVGLVNLKKANSGSAMQTVGTATVGECVDRTAEPTVQSCVVTGSAFGGSVAAGFHSFFNDYVALSVELRDIAIKDNPAGRDVNGDQFADKRDLTWTQHWMATLGVSVFFPKADISP